MRSHWEAIADALLAGVQRFATPRRALLHLPGGRPSMHGRVSDGLEGFARSSPDGTRFAFGAAP